MAGPLRLGMPTPSPDTVPEPATCATLAGMPGVTARFQRLRVLSTALDDGSTGRFDPAPMVAAAERLADARVHAVCRDGTSGAGPAAGRALRAAVAAETGIPVLDSVAVALWGALRAAGEAPALPG